MDEVKIKAQIDALLSLPQAGINEKRERAAELLQGALTLLEIIHGRDCAQIVALNATVAANHQREPTGLRSAVATIQSAEGTLRTLKREVEAGLAGNLRREITGEVLGDFLQLAKAALDEGGEGRNVASVLAAAAFEDTIRRMGASYCGIHARDDLQSIAVALKEAGILVGAQFGTVQAQLQFRNDALHADWAKIDVIGVKTVILLVQELLLKHF
jgi:hypothetical protein